MAMSLEQARAEARRLMAADPKFRRMNMDTLVAKIMANEGMDLGPIQTRGGISEEKIFSGFLPKPVTPASPAPVRPGVPVMAPRPEAVRLPQPAMGGPLERARAGDMPAPAPAAPPPAAAPAPAPAREGQRKAYSSPLRAALDRARSELDTMNAVAEQIKASGQDLPADAKLRIDLAQRKVQALEAEADAEEAAQIDPQVEAIIARQEGAVEEERARAAADKARAPWDALTAGGLALMNPRKGANFLAALGEGLGVGLESYDTARAEAAERKARLGREADQLALQRIDALAKARDIARNAIRRGEEVDERGLRMANLTNDAIISAATQQAVIDKAIADASKAKTQAQYAPAREEAEIGVLRGQEFNYRNPDRRDGRDGPSETAVYEQTNKAAKDATEKAPVVRKAFKDWQKSENGKANIRSGPEWDNYQAELRIYQNLVKRGKMEKVLPNLGPITKGEKAAARKPAGSSKPTLRYDPKTGTFVST